MKKINFLFGAFIFCVFSLNAQNEFITTWKTNNPGTSNNNQITIPTHPNETYNYTVDWGDGNSDAGVTENITHTYASTDTYTVTITGLFPSIYFNNSGDKDKIITIEQWGNNPWSTMNRAFYGCSILNITNPSIDVPNLSNVLEAYDMFRDATSFTGNYISNWDVSSITNMDYMFSGAFSFNGNISLWNVSNVTKMFAMFNNAQNFNQDIGNWDVSNVITMRNMFAHAYLFNQDISGWNVSEVKSMKHMFTWAVNFNQDIGDWNVAKVTEMNAMFYIAVNFDQNLSNWDITKVLDMSDMFISASLSTVNYDATLIGWATDTSGNSADGIDDIPSNIIFTGGNSTYCAAVSKKNELETTYNWTISDGDQEANCFITTWKTNNSGVSSNNQITIPTFSGETYDYDVYWGDGNVDTGIMGNITHTFPVAGTYTVAITGLFPRIYFHSNNGPTDRNKILTIEQWGDNPWTSMVFAFSFCNNLTITNPNIDSPNLSNTDNTTGMFNYCFNFNGDTTNWDVSTIKFMQVMFRESRKFNQDIGAWDVSNVTNMVSMFEGADDFDQNLGNWDISNLNNATDMFLLTGLSTPNYDAIIKGWATDSSGTLGDAIDDIPLNVPFHAGNSSYCISEEEREYLITTANWNINDAGRNTNCINGFITIWDTYDSTGNTNSNEITIPTFPGETYNYTVDWGDGSSDTGVNGDITHTYSNQGIYSVVINGIFPRIYINAGSVRGKLLSIEQWGNISWQSMENAFFACSNLTINASDAPDLTNVENMSNMFSACNSLNSDLSDWDVSSVQLMDHMFSYSSSFNGDISNWDVSNVQSMSHMFAYASSFNQDIGNWIVSNVSNMELLFLEAEAFNQNIGNWNTGNVINMKNMFVGAEVFNQDIGSWDTSNVMNMKNMFVGAIAFNQNLSNWDLSKVTLMDDMFDLAELSTSNYDATLIGWATDSSGTPGDGIDDIPSSITFNGGNSIYCLGENAWNELDTAYSWTISDGGKSCNIVLSPKIYLQGAALNPNTGEETLMRDDLRVAGIIPTTSPYSDNATCDAAIFNTTGTDAIVDWVWVELRDATDNTMIKDSKSALLQRDGDIVAIDGISSVEFNQTPDNYYIAIKHRNHLGIMTTNTLALSAVTTSVDFTNGNSQITFGSNAQTTSGMQSGVVAMWSGNANDDTVVQYSGTSPDSPDILSEVLNNAGNFLNFPTFAVSGYNVNDVNMDGNTQYSGTNPDTPFILQNILAHPGNFLNFSTYQIIEQLPEN